MYGKAIHLTLAISLLLPMVPPSVLPRPCCSTTHAAPASQPVKTCACKSCKHREPAPQKEQTPNQLPTPCGCAEWCCGAGFVPLCMIALDPTPVEPSLSDALAYAAVLHCQEFVLSIEHPPRLRN